MIATTFLIATYWRDVVGAIGFNIAQKRVMRKRRSRYSIVTWLVISAIAFGMLRERPGTILNPSGTNTPVATVDIAGRVETPLNRFLNGFGTPSLSGFLRNDWLGMAFPGLVIVRGLVLVPSRVSQREIGEKRIEELREGHVQGLQAAHEAIGVIDDNTIDPRSRIIKRFQHMTAAVSSLDVPISSDQTARQLERAIRSTFMIKGSATSELTQRFEEARYSLHKMSEEGALHARQSLGPIEDELKIQLDN